MELVKMLLSDFFAVFESQTVLFNWYFAIE